MEITKYSLKAFFFSFAYYFGKKNFIFALITFVLSLALPLEYYFFISFIASAVYFFKGGEKELRGYKKKLRYWNVVVVGCVSMVIFVVLKLLILGVIKL